MTTLVAIVGVAISAVLVAWARRAPRRETGRFAQRRQSRRRSVAVWSVAATSGLALVLAIGVQRWSPPELHRALIYWGLLASLPVGILTRRSPRGRLVASGLLFGFASASGILYAESPCIDAMFWPCAPEALAQWTIVVTIALAVSVLLGAYPWGDDDVVCEPGLPAGRLDRDARSGPELLRAIERNVGVAVVVQEIASGEPVRIDALLMYGRFSEQVTAGGPTEADAWRSLAEQAVAWRNANDKQVPLWWGAGGA